MYSYPRFEYHMVLTTRQALFHHKTFSCNGREGSEFKKLKTFIIIMMTRQPPACLAHFNTNIHSLQTPI